MIGPKLCFHQLQWEIFLDALFVFNKNISMNLLSRGNKKKEKSKTIENKNLYIIQQD